MLIVGSSGCSLLIIYRNSTVFAGGKKTDSIWITDVFIKEMSIHNSVCDEKYLPSIYLKCKHSMSL